MNFSRYTCIATNAVGSDDLETSLEVVAIPVILGNKHEKLEVIENFRQDLICDVGVSRQFFIEYVDQN